MPLSEEYYPTGKSTPEGLTSQGRSVLPLMVRFRCPKCKAEVVEDAWDGPVSCTVKSPDHLKHASVWMQPISIVRDVIDQGYHPDSQARPEAKGVSNVFKSQEG